MTDPADRPIRDPAADLSLPSPADLSPDQIARYLAHGRHLRARAVAASARAFWRWITRTGPKLSPADALEQELLSALTAIRASAEVLRDHPGITPVERNRFLGIVLDEERRMEQLLPKLVRLTGKQRKA
ncbi:MAG: hypothetical protein AAGF44_02060 [Pseudomonadota bacterium]